jgi:chemotaxis protein methyltransferase CheR
MEKQAHMAIINRRINELLGLHFLENQWDSLERRLKQFADALQIDNSPENISQWISQHDIPKNELEVLIDHLTICETYFFREKLALNLLKEKIIPSIEASSQKEKMHLNIWCAGCSTGEEPYSLAITLKESLPWPEQWEVTLLGTDINARALEKARGGIYSPWSFRDTPAAIKKKYFSESEKNLVIKPDIKKMVQFSRHNLATDPFPATSDGGKQWDVIFCRNVLMYFSPDVIKRITGKIYDSLKSEAWLITSQVELNDDYFGVFKRVMFDNGIFYRKSPKETLITQQEQSLFANKSRPSFLSPKQERKHSTAQAGQRNRLKTSTQVQIKKQEHSLISQKSDDQFVSKEMELFVKGRALADAGKLDEAAAAMSTLLTNGGGQAEHFFVYATILIEMERFQEADQNLVRALYLEPDHHAARLNRSQLLRKTGKHVQASKEMRNLLDDISTFDDHEPLPHLDGMTAGRVRQMAGLFGVKT